jgi:uncharacterized membrane protein
MTTGRLEAFSDGVIAIIITIMVLELSVPEGAEFSDLAPLLPKFVSYILSFIYVGIYWNNHHHLFQAVEKVNGKVLWSNLFLLFMLSLLPFTTAWMGENHFDKNPVALYGGNLVLCAIAYIILLKAALKHEGKESKIGGAIRNTRKENTSVIVYTIGICLSYYVPIASIFCYFAVALIWIIPDRRIEKFLE